MYTDIPVCKRCCFCLPLRYGLIVWGYLKLITGFVTLSIVYKILYIYDFLTGPFITEEAVFAAICGIISLLDVILGIILIVGCHKKNVTLMRVFYYCNTVLVMVMIVLCVYRAISLVEFLLTNPYKNDFWIRTFTEDIIETIIYYAYVGLQIYISLLVRSEIVKLRNGCQFRFVNNEAEAQCTVALRDFNEEQETEK